MCGQAPATTNYVHNMEKRKIKQKDLEILQRWGQGALARRNLLKTVTLK